MPYKDKNKQYRAVKDWYQKNKDRWKSKVKGYQQRNKFIVISTYGGKCVCCKEKELEFLAIDHIDGDGAKHRLEVMGSSKKRGGSKTYAWLIRNNYPEGFQVLCHNCNFSKFFNKGFCVHNLKKRLGKK